MCVPGRVGRHSRRGLAGSNTLTRSAHPSSLTQVFVGSQDFLKTVLGERLSKVVRRRMCPDVGTFTLSLEERKKAGQKQYLLFFSLLTLFER